MANAPLPGQSSDPMIGNQSSFGGSMQDQGSASGKTAPASGIASDSGGAGQQQKDLLSRASEKLLGTAEEQKMAGANFVGDMVKTVRRVAGEFEGQIPQAAEYIRYAADQMETVSDAVRRRDVRQIVSELQSFARQQPTAFLGATFLAGFAAVRFLKSSSSGASSSMAAMQAPRPTAMARYGDFGGRTPDPSFPHAES